MKSYWLWEDEDGLHADGANPEDWPKEGSYVPAAIAEALLAACEAALAELVSLNDPIQYTPVWSARRILRAAIRQARGEVE